MRHHAFALAYSAFFIEDRVLSRARMKNAIGIGQNQCVLVLRMFKEIKDAVLFHEPGNKIEIGLTVLHAIIQWQMFGGGGITIVDIGEGAFQFIKNGLDDLDNGLILEYA